MPKSTATRNKGDNVYKSPKEGEKIRNFGKSEVQPEEKKEARSNFFQRFFNWK